jgi:hypothetical protein
VSAHEIALTALGSLCAGERDAIEILRRLVRRVRADASPARQLEAQVRRRLNASSTPLDRCESAAW